MLRSTFKPIFLPLAAAFALIAVASASDRHSYAPRHLAPEDREVFARTLKGSALSEARALANETAVTVKKRTEGNPKSAMRKAKRMASLAVAFFDGGHEQEASAFAREAIRALKRVSKRGGENAVEALCLRASLHEMLGETPEAQLCYKAALARDPRCQRAKIGLARYQTMNIDDLSDRELYEATR